MPRQRHALTSSNVHQSKDDTELTSSSPKQSRHHGSSIGRVPLTQLSSQSHENSIRHHHTNVDINSVDKHSSISTQMARGSIPIDFRQKIHGIYVLPVSPALSSSSSTTNTDDGIQTNSNTMPIRSRRHLTSSINTHRGIQNHSFADSPQPKDRTFPRMHSQTLKRMPPPPSEPPPQPPLHLATLRQHMQMSVDDHANQTAYERKSVMISLDPNALEFRIANDNIYGAIDDYQVKNVSPPPVPSRSQKPIVVPIGFEEILTRTDKLDFQTTAELSPHDDCSEHHWPKPPESMTVSQISAPLQTLSPSIPYDRLHHDHLIPTVNLRQHSTMNFIQLPRNGEQSMLTESDT
jgi:hypothetical protein